MPRLGFGAFLAPHHPIGENPMLQFRRDLDLVEHLDKLGYDEFWCGEHHSSGWEMIASPEMFLAAAGERTKRIRLGTGVVSLPYHHPFNVAQRMVQLDHMTGGRAIFGSGPGALASDAHTLGIDPMVQRDRQDEAIGVIRRLLQRRARHRQERLVHAAGRGPAAAAAAGGDAVRRRLADQPVGHDAGRQARHRHHLDRLDVERRACNALPTQWGFAEDAAAKHGQTVDRKNWRVLLSWHIAETREKARERGPRRPAALAQRIHRRHPAAAGRASRSSRPTRRSTRPPSSTGAAADDRHARRSRRTRSSRCSTSAAASAPSSASSTTGPTRRTPCAAGTWWRATSCPRSTAISPACANRSSSCRPTARCSSAPRGRHGQDHGERRRRRRARGHRSPPSSPSPPATCPTSTRPAPRRKQGRARRPRGVEP